MPRLILVLLTLAVYQFCCCSRFSEDHFARHAELLQGGKADSDPAQMRHSDDADPLAVLTTLFLRMSSDIIRRAGVPLDDSLAPRRASDLRALASEIDIVDRGSLVEFARAGKSDTQLGAVVGRDGKSKWNVAALDGSRVSIKPNQVRFVIEKNVPDSGIKSRLQSLGEARQKQCSYEFMQDLHEAVLGEGGFDISTLTELAFDDPSSTSQYTLYRCLHASDIGELFFKADKAGTLFTPRTMAEVEGRRIQWEAMEARRQELVALEARILSATSDAPLNISAESEDLQNKFKAVARFGSLLSMDGEQKELDYASEMGTMWPLVKDFLQELGYKATPSAAKMLMVKVGLWGPHENLDLIRLGIATEFTDQELATAASLAAAPPPDVDAPRRRNLTHLLAFAIDDKSTVEVDDAISVEALSEEEGGGEIIWVHIADPTRYVHLNSVLEKEARNRGSTLYLPFGSIPMIPLELAAGPCSLTTNENEPSPALSIGVRLTVDGDIDANTPPILTPSLVNVERMTYEDVDDLLDPFEMMSRSSSDERLKPLLKLDHVSNKRKAWRKGRGSSNIYYSKDLPDTKIKVAMDEVERHVLSVDVSLESSGGPSQRIVSECMLLANQAVAKYAAANSIPAAFRGQKYKELSDKAAEAFDDTPDDYTRTLFVIRRFMSPGFVSATPVPHAALGIDEYLQTTSPIRRYADLAMHYQLKAHLRGDPPPFTAQEMISFATEGPDRHYRSVERKSKAYWMREWLSRRKGDTIPALVLSHDTRGGGNTYDLLLETVGAIVSCKPNRPLEIGEQISVSPDANGELRC